MNRNLTKQREISNGRRLCIEPSGHFYLRPTNSSPISETIAISSTFKLGRNAQSLADLSNMLQAEARKTNLTNLDYVVLVPTLRCDLNCSYCQVSRANENAKGFDWTDETLNGVITFLDGLSTSSIKIEFQGGEPTLRIDLIKAIINQCDRFKEKQFVICTNLSNLAPDFLELLNRPDVFVSTSLDGGKIVHQRNRTETDKRTNSFYQNLDFLINKYGPGKVSALPTIDPENPPGIDELIDEYSSRGLTSIYLRPINYMGFARKRHPKSREKSQFWYKYFREFIENIINRNWENRRQVLEESYLSLCLRRIFKIGLDRHVDLRNPNPIGVDYALIDFDGKVYPTDEARMLTRSGVIDLAIGDVWNGFDTEACKMLNAHSTNYGDEVCDKCPYQPFCGRDLVDDLSRYGRIDLPRNETAFCQKHIKLFDFCFELIYSDDAKVRFSLARWLGLAGEFLPLQRITR